MRKGFVLVALLVLLVAVALSASVAITDADANPTTAACSCHAGAIPNGIHAAATYPTHAVTACATCHTAGTSNPPPSSACVTCHSQAEIEAQGAHISGGCWTTVGCHGYTEPTPTPTPTPTDTDTPTPTPTPTDEPTVTPTPTTSPTDDGDLGGVTDEDADNEADAVGFPATGYPPSGGDFSWLLVTGAFATGGALLLGSWKLRAATRRHD